MENMEMLIKYCYEQHKKAFEKWENGKPCRAYWDLDGLKIFYENGKYWHYKILENNSVEWW